MGFVQTNNQIGLGGTLVPLSDYAGSQYELNFLVWKDPEGGNWWLQVGDKYLLGYWPASLFLSLFDSASEIHWGGEVINSQQGGEYTSTQMGSVISLMKGTAGLVFSKISKLLIVQTFS